MKRLIALSLVAGSMLLGVPAAQAATTANVTAGNVVYDPNTGTSGTVSLTITCSSDDPYQSAAVDAELVQDSTGARDEGDTADIPCGPDPETTTVKMNFSDLTGFVDGPAKLQMIVGDSTVFVRDSTGVHNYVATNIGVVPPPPMTLSGVAVAPTTFYPRVHDGYRDTTTLSYTLKHQYRTPNVGVKVTNRAGATVKSASLAASAKTWAWGGRKNDGTLAPVGDYKITLSASDSGTPTVRASKWVTVATGHRYRTTTKTFYGENGARSTSGDCTAIRNTYDGLMELDCSGGKYARATYGFSLPSSATNLSWKVRGDYPDTDYCCQGSVTKTGKRTTTTHYRVQVTVTGWRAYDVSYAQITYTYRYAI